jgi:hypothetical protein
MALFRKKCDSKEALSFLHAIIIPQATADEGLTSHFADLANHDRLRHEFSALRLFTVLVASEDTRHPDWKDRGRGLFDELFEAALRSIMAEYQESELLARPWLAERVKYYALSQHMATSMDALGTEVGKGFGMLFAEPPSDAFRA